MKTLHLIDLDFTMFTYEYTEMTLLNQGLVLDALLLDHPEKDLVYKQSTVEFLRFNEKLANVQKDVTSGIVYFLDTGRKVTLFDYIQDNLPNFGSLSKQDKLHGVERLINELKKHDSEVLLVSSHWKAMYFSLLVFIKQLWEDSEKKEKENLSAEESNLILKLKEKYPDFKSVLVKGLNLWNSSGSVCLTKALEHIKERPFEYISNTEEIKNTLQLIQKTKSKTSDHVFVLLTASVCSYVNSMFSNFVKKDEELFDFYSIFASKPSFYDLENQKEYTEWNGNKKYYSGGSFNELLKKLNLGIDEVEKIYLYEDALVAGILMPNLLNEYITPVFIDRFDDDKKLNISKHIENGIDMLNKNTQVFKDFEDALKNNINNNLLF